jgi:hypothetical protein
MYVCCNLWKDLFEIDLLKIKILYLIKIDHNIELTKHTILSHPMMTIDTYIIKSSKYHIVQTQENLNIPIKIHNNYFIWNKTNFIFAFLAALRGISI